MTLARFNEVAAAQFDYCAELMQRKGKEYARGRDRLEHFKLSGEMQGVSPKRALWGMLTKHILSLSQMCSDEQGATTGMWIEKISDAMNYLILLRALVEEDTGNE